MLEREQSLDAHLVWAELQAARDRARNDALEEAAKTVKVILDRAYGETIARIASVAIRALKTEDKPHDALLSPTGHQEESDPYPRFTASPLSKEQGNG